MVIEEDSGLAMSKWKQECPANRNFELRIRYPNVEISRLFIHSSSHSRTFLSSHSQTSLYLTVNHARGRARHGVSSAPYLSCGVNK
jgi:hypothetical protein